MNGRTPIGPRHRAALVLATIIGAAVVVAGLAVVGVRLARGDADDGGRAGTARGPADATADPAVTPALPPSPAPPGRAPAGATGRLRIAALGVDAAIVPVGVQPDGQMEVPPVTEVGWYRFGPTPGEEGSSVLAAHVDYDGVPGAFFRLRDMRPGDGVEIARADAPTLRFTVESVERFPKDALPADRVFTRGGPAALALITCGGEFDRGARSYRDNVVVFARPAG